MDDAHPPPPRSNYCRSPDAAYDAFRAFCRDLAAIGRCSLLLVSGSPRKKLDTVAVSLAPVWGRAARTAFGCSAGAAAAHGCAGWAPARPCPAGPQALERAAADPQLRQLQLPLAVAFNPYFPDEQRQQEERQRLRRKLVAGGSMVQAIYLQVRPAAGQAGAHVGLLGMHSCPQVGSPQHAALCACCLQAGSDVGRLEVSLQWLCGLLDELEQSAASARLPAPKQQDGARPAKRQRQQRVDEKQHQGGQADSSRRPQQAAQLPAGSAGQPASDAGQRNVGAGGSGSVPCPAQPASRRIQVHGSLLVPSKKLLAQMRFRPWGGVFLRCVAGAGAEFGGRAAAGRWLHVLLPLLLGMACTATLPQQHAQCSTPATHPLHLCSRALQRGVPWQRGGR